VRIWNVPTIQAIQRTTAVFTILTAAIILVAGSPAAALGSLFGGALMIANLYVLVIVGRSMIAVAQQRGGASALAVIIPPMKMLALAAIVYLVIQSGRVNVQGFIAGSLTQFVAIFIETWRAASTVIPDPNQTPPATATHSD
jgi:hypothetical protein